MNNKPIIANWKNHPDTLAEAQEILESVNDYLESTGEKKEFNLVFCPPFVFLEGMGRMLKNSHLEHESSLGAQNIAIDNGGAMTGEVSGVMLNKLGVSYVIIGHSERRWKLGETDEIVNKKLKAALKNELIPIICIGEKTRENNFKKFLQNQIAHTFNELTLDEVNKCIIAYEPVWAISTNPNAKPDTPESALESIKIIKDFLTNHYPLVTNHYLYGGSVNSKNIGDFIKEKYIDGVLVGGASVNKEEFVKMLTEISKSAIM